MEFINSNTFLKNNFINLDEYENNNIKKSFVTSLIAINKSFNFSSVTFNNHIFAVK